MAAGHTGRPGSSFARARYGRACAGSHVGSHSTNHLRTYEKNTASVSVVPASRTADSAPGSGFEKGCSGHSRRITSSGMMKYGT